LARSSGCALIVAVTKMDRLSVEGRERTNALEKISQDLLEKGWVWKSYIFFSLYFVSCFPVVVVVVVVVVYFSY
jgi:hypothetical protein